MARDGYLSIRISSENKQLLDQFVEARGINKATLFDDMAVKYMYETDEELFLELKKGNKNENFLMKRKLLSEHYDDAIFLRITNAYDVNRNSIPEQQVIQEYIANINSNGLGYTWFSTNALPRGMSPKRVDAYNKLIKLGVGIDFFIAFASTNDFGYRAKVLEVRSDCEGIKKPEEAAIPDVFKYEEKPKIWLKVTDLVEDDKLSTSDFTIRSTNRNLKEVLDGSQYLMGYIYRNQSEFEHKVRE